MIRGNDFLKLRMEAGFSSWPKLAAFLHVSTRTVRNWERTGVPYSVEKFLRLLAGDLSFMGDDWRGWRIVGGEFVEYSGAGYSVSPGEMRAFTHMERCIEFQRNDINRLKADIMALRAQLHFQELLNISFSE